MIQDSGFRIQNSGFGIRDSGFEIRDSGIGIRDSDSCSGTSGAGAAWTDPPRDGTHHLILQSHVREAHIWTRPSTKCKIEGLKISQVLIVNFCNESRPQKSSFNAGFQNLIWEKELNQNLFGNEVYYPNSLLLQVKNMLCSDLDCQGSFTLILFSDKIGPARIAAWAASLLPMVTNPKFRSAYCMRVDHLGRSTCHAISGRRD